MNDTALHRVFWAVCPPEACIRRAARLIEQLRDPVRRLGLDVAWVRPDSLHITLKFLGDVTDAQLGTMTAQLDEVVWGRQPLRESLIIDGLGAFPDLARPRVLFANIFGASTRQSPTELVALARVLENTLVSLGYRADEHPFHPHLTLGRVKGGQPDRTGTRREALAELANKLCESPLSEPFVPTEIILLESSLRPDGAHYTPLHTIGLPPRPQSR